MAHVYLGHCRMFGLVGKESARQGLLRDEVEKQAGAHRPKRGIWTFSCRQGRAIESFRHDTYMIKF